MSISKRPLVALNAAELLHLRGRTLRHLARIKSWRDEITADVEAILSESCAEHFDQVVDRGFGCAVGERGS